MVHDKFTDIEGKVDHLYFQWTGESGLQAANSRLRESLRCLETGVPKVSESLTQCGDRLQSLEVTTSQLQQGSQGVLAKFRHEVTGEFSKGTYQMRGVFHKI